MRQRYHDIDEKNERLQGAMQRLRQQLPEFEEKYLISWIYHENGLEGQVLSYHELKSAIDMTILSDVSLVPTYQNVKNHKVAIDFIREEAQNKRGRITLSMIKKLHGMLLGTADAEEAGRYRKEIPLHRTYFHEIVQPNRISYSMGKLVDFYASNEAKSMHPIHLACLGHAKFMKIFPFTDHSGKIGRMLMNLLLMRNDYWPAILLCSERQRYYEALRGKEAEFRGLRELVLESMENSLNNALKFFDEGPLEEEERRTANVR